MVDYREKDPNLRLEYLVNYYHWSLKFYDCDPSLYLLNYIYRRMELNVEQRYWMAWLYGNSYQLATAWVVANEFPDFENVDLQRLVDWNEENYSRLRYQVDQKWQKGHLPKMFDSYREMIYKDHKTQHEFFTDLCSSEDPNENFDTLYKFIVKHLYKFGRYSAWFYIQTLKETCGLNVEPRDLLLKDDNTHTQRDGLSYSLGKDEWVGDKEVRKSPDKISALDAQALLVIDRVREIDPDLRPDMFGLETTLCAFKKTFRRSRGRYLGYYLDRQFEDIKKVQEDDWPGIEWQLLWDGRNEILDKRTIRTTGVVKSDMEHFLDTGEIKYFDYLKSEKMENIGGMKSKDKSKEFELIRITQDDQKIIEKLEKWGKESDECAHFNSLWTRFKNWDKENAYVYVLMHGKKIAGMNAFTCNTRNPYVNCYYFEIDEEYRQMGLGSKLFFSCIEEGKKRGNERLTLRTKKGSLGMKFYNAIGMKERWYDPKSKENIFDFSLAKIKKIKDIRKHAKKINDAPHPGRAKLYAKYEKL